MSVTKYNLYRKRFGTNNTPDYKGKIMINNVSPRLSSNTKMSYLLDKIETIVQSWIDSVSYLRKMKNYRVDIDDNDTIV